jgi:hypothetical protein
VIDWDERLRDILDRSMSVRPLVDGTDAPLALIESGTPKSDVAFVVFSVGMTAKSAVLASAEGDYTGMVVLMAGPPASGDLPERSSLRYDYARCALKAALARGDEALAYGWPVAQTPLRTEPYRSALESNLAFNSNVDLTIESGDAPSLGEAIDTVQLYFSDSIPLTPGTKTTYELELELD